MSRNRKRQRNRGAQNHPACLGGTDPEDSRPKPKEKTQVPTPEGARSAQDMKAPRRRPRKQGQVGEIARAILSGLESMFKEGREKSRQAWTKIFNMAKKAAKAIIAWVKEHPYITAGILIAIAVAVLWPFVLKALGFGQLGPVAGTFASWWQSTFAGFVPAGSLFSSLQALGMSLL